MGISRHTFSFLSPYPIEECYNMIHEYSRVDDFLYTKWGETPGNVLDGWLFIGTFVQAEGHLDFVMKTVEQQALKMRGEGSFKTEGDKTRISGSVEYMDAGVWWSCINAILVIGISLFGCSGGVIPPFNEYAHIIGPMMFILFFVLLVGNIGVYFMLARQIRRPSIILKRLLGQKAHRKQKQKGI